MPAKNNEYSASTLFLDSEHKVAAMLLNWILYSHSLKIKITT